MRHVLVGERLGLAERRVEHLSERGRDPDLARPALRVDLRQLVERRVHLVAQRLRRRADRVQQRVHDALGVGEQREEQVLGLDRLVVPRDRLLASALERRLRLHRQLVRIHLSFLIQSVTVTPYSS